MLRGKLIQPAVTSSRSYPALLRVCPLYVTQESIFDIRPFAHIDPVPNSISADQFIGQKLGLKSLRKGPVILYKGRRPCRSLNHTCRLRILNMDIYDI